jgi:anti-sigma B factor antagonist
MRNAERIGIGQWTGEGRPEPFRVEIRPDRERVLVAPHGELDLATVDQVAAEIDDLVARGFDAIVIDLRATSFLDSSGLCLLLRQTARTDAHITVIDGSAAVSRLFDLTGVRHALPFEAAR